MLLNAAPLETPLCVANKCLPELHAGDTVPEEM